jgi:hypothetical protein
MAQDEEPPNPWQSFLRLLVRKLQPLPKPFVVVIVCLVTLLGWVGMQVVAGLIFEPPLSVRACNVPIFAGMCKARGWGGQINPALQAQIDAAATPKQLEEIRRLFPDGRTDAAIDRALRTCRRQIVWLPETIPEPAERVIADLPLVPSRDAEAAALAAAQHRAAMSCSSFRGGAFRLRAAHANGHVENCIQVGSRRTCGWRGVYVCEVLMSEEAERCGPS